MTLFMDWHLMNKLLLATITASSIVLTAGSAMANLVTNGQFAFTCGANNAANPASSYCTANGGQVGFNANVAGWTATPTGLSGNLAPSGSMTGYTFVFAPGAADGAGVGVANNSAAQGADPNYNLSLYPLTVGTVRPTPPAGNIIGADGDYPISATAGVHTGIQQTITGLSTTKPATLTFTWAAAQQSGFDGPTIQNWRVSLGGETFDFDTYSLPEHGFSGWLSASHTFNNITATSELLQFLAIGNVPVPPITLLADVSLTQPADPPPCTVNCGGGAPPPRPGLHG